jgi:PAS domain S-box-containing protein
MSTGEPGAIGLWDNEGRFQALVEELQVGVLVQGNRSEVLFANRAALELLGLSQEQLLGHTSLEATALACREDGTPFPGEEHPGPRALATGRPVRNVVVGFYRPASKDRAWLLVNAHPQLDDAGRPQQVVVTLTDMSNERATVEKLKESESRYRRLVEQATDIIYRTDVKGFFTYANPVASRFMGFAEPDLIGKHFTELIRPDQRDRVHALLTDQFRRRLPGTYDEFVAVTKDGREVWIGQNVQLLLEGEKVEGFQAVARDITERKRAEETLQRLVQSRSEMLEGLRQKLQAPASAVLGMAVLLRESELNESQREWVRSAEASARELQALVEAIPEAPAAQGAMKPAMEPPVALERATVLVAEDHPMNRRVVAAMLESLGYKVETVADGMEAVEACSRRRYEAILMDCQMPGVDGFRATAWIREREGGQRRTPIIALTASVLPGEREKCFAAGMDDYLAKPIGLKALDAALKKWIVPPGASAAADAPPKLPSELPDDHPLRALESQGRANLVVEIIDLFLQTTPVRLEGLRDAHRTGDTAGFLSVAHSLKGAAIQLGARGIAELCSRLQTEARGGDVFTARALLEELEEEYQKVSTLLQAERARLAPERAS